MTVSPFELSIVHEISCGKMSVVTETSTFNCPALHPVGAVGVGAVGVGAVGVGAVGVGAVGAVGALPQKSG